LTVDQNGRKVSFQRLRFAKIGASKKPSKKPPKKRAAGIIGGIGGGVKGE